VFTLNQTTCEQLVAHATKTLEQREKEATAREYDPDKAKERREEMKALEATVAKLEAQVCIACCICRRVHPCEFLSITAQHLYPIIVG
jgi:ferredoxin